MDIRLKHGRNNPINKFLNLISQKYDSSNNISYNNYGRMQFLVLLNL